MKSLVILSLLFASIAQARQDNNIVSVLVGQGPAGVEQTPNAPSSSSNSTSTCSSPGNSNCNGNSGNTTTVNNITNTLQGDGTKERRDAVVGLMYQRRIENSPLILGVLVQTNQTYSTIVGVSF